jgi:hypothetical protein
MTLSLRSGWILLSPATEKSSPPHEHFDVADLEASFAPDRAEKAKASAARCDIIMIIGGCYYWTLRSIAWRAQ